MDTQEYRRMCVDWINEKTEQRQARELVEAILIVVAAFSVFFISLLIF